MQLKVNPKQILNTRNFIIILGCLIILELGLLFLPQTDQALGKTLDKYAAEVVSTCAPSNYKPACYDKEIPKLMDYISMEDAFKVTSIVQVRDRSYTYCHVLAHELSAREVIKNPDQWKDVVTRVPSGLCSNGGIHGAFQERFRAEYLSREELEAIKPELLDICEPRGSWAPTGLEQASCYHAVGHLTMYVTNADINHALSLCNDLAIKSGRDYSQLCYDGAFMQIHQPLEPEDFALIEGKEVKKDELEAFCNKFKGQQKGSCWTEGWPLFREELQESQYLTFYCSKTEPTERSRCYEALIYVRTAQLGLDSEKILLYCKGLTTEYKASCLASAASRMIETDYRNITNAVSLCNTGSSFDKEGACYAKLVLYSTYNYHSGSRDYYEVCESLPQTWKDKCLNKKK